MTVNPLTLLKDSPERPADWRFQRALLFMADDARRPKRSRDGQDSYKWIHLARDFMLQFQAAENIDQHLSVRDSYPEVYECYNIYRNPNSTLRNYLEAMLLAHDTDFLQIATLCALTPAQVDAYEAVFYNVRDRRQADHYIKACVLRLSEDTASPTYFEDKVIKLFAWRAGWRVASQLISGLGKLPSSNNLDQVRNSITEGVIDMVRSKTMNMLGRKMYAPLHEGDVAVINVFHALEKFRKDQSAGAGAQDQISLAVRAMFESSQLYVGSKAVNSQAKTVEFDSTSIELRYTEQLSLGYGQSNPQLQELSKLTMEGIIAENAANSTDVHTDT